MRSGVRARAYGFREVFPRGGGFTLLELMAAVAISCLVLGIAVPSYRAHVVRTQTRSAISDIGQMQLRIEQYSLNTGSLPASLADIGMGDRLDPWGNPYVYLSFDGLKGKGAMRKDKNLVPVNTDYDLYSKGPDGASVAPFTAKPSRDDIVRANDGNFIGLAADY